MFLPVDTFHRLLCCLNLMPHMPTNLLIRDLLQSKACRLFGGGSIARHPLFSIESPMAMLPEHMNLVLMSCTSLVLLRLPSNISCLQLQEGHCAIAALGRFSGVRR